MASITSWERSPLPIIQVRPKSNRRGANLSILPAVVGPQEPMGIPAGAGVGPA